MRAEELIMHVWTQRKQLLAAGKRPTRIVLSRADYDLLQRYHRGLGSLPAGVEDYLSRYALFGLPFYLDDSVTCTVGCEEIERPERGV